MKNLYATVFLVLLLSVSFNSFAQAPVFNSFPSAQAVLLLDFDGHTVNGTSWNGNGLINCAPPNLKNDQVTKVYNRELEDNHLLNIK